MPCEDWVDVTPASSSNDGDHYVEPRRKKLCQASLTVWLDRKVRVSEERLIQSLYTAGIYITGYSYIACYLACIIRYDIANTNFQLFKATDEINRVQDESCDLSKNGTTSFSDNLSESSFSTISVINVPASYTGKSLSEDDKHFSC